MPIVRRAWILTLSAIIGCGGGEKPRVDTTAISGQPSPTAGATTGATAATGGAPRPITGKTWDVKMIGDASGYRFDPVSLTIKPGDGVRWTVVSGPPHNVSFWSDSIPPSAVATLTANMPQTTAPLAGPLLTSPGQTYTVSFAGAPAGTYHYACTPHLALGMKGTITVR